MLTAARNRRPRPASPALRLATSRATSRADRLPAEPPETKHPPAEPGSPALVGDEAQHEVLRVDRAGRLQPGDALDGRAGDQHVEQERGLGRRGRDKAKEPRAVRGEHGRSYHRGVHAQHLVRVVRLVTKQAPQRGIEFGRVPRAFIQRDWVQPQPVLRIRQHRPDHLLRRGIHAMHGRNLEPGDAVPQARERTAAASPIVGRVLRNPPNVLEQRGSSHSQPD